MRTQKTDWPLILAILVAVVGWSSAWVSIRVAVRTISPAHVALGRYLVASLALIPIWVRNGSRRPDRADWPGLWLMGLLGFTLYNLAVNAGETTVSAGTAAFLAATIPVFSALGALVWLGERFETRVWQGIALAFAGVACIASSESGTLAPSKGALLILAAAMCAAGYGLLGKTYLKRYPPISVITWAIWLGTISLLPFARGAVHDWTNANRLAQLNLVCLGLFPGALGYACWTYAMSKLPLSRLTSFLYVVAPLTSLMGWLFLGELPTGRGIFGGIVTLSGVIWVNTKGRQITK